MHSLQFAPHIVQYGMICRRAGFESFFNFETCYFRTLHGGNHGHAPESRYMEDN